MRILAVMLMMLAGLGTTALSATPEQIASLIERLGSTEYRERQAAFRELDAIGDAALTGLRSFANAGDTETRSRALELVRRIEQRQASARILAPSLVEIDIDQMSVRDAIPVAAKVVNMPTVLVGNASKLGDRKVTYHSGKVPVWEAMEGFFQAAQLTEWDGLSIVPGLPTPQPTTPDANHQVFFRGNGRMVIAGSRNGRSHQPALDQIHVYDAVAPSVPTFSAGAVRLRALPIGTPIPNATAHGDEIVVPLQVTAESKIGWSFTTSSIKTASAIDDAGQSLAATIVSPIPMSSGDSDNIFLNNMMMNPLIAAQGMVSPRSQFVSLRLRKGPIPSKVLKELRGTLTLPVRVADELAAIERPISESGSTKKGEHAELTLRSVERTNDDHFRMEINMLLSPEAQLSMLAANPVGVRGNIRFNGAFFPQLAAPNAAIAEGADEYFGISLADANGARYTIGHTGSPNVTYNADGMRLRVAITFVPRKNTLEPAKLAVNGTRPASAEFAFSFKDVPVQ